MGCTFWIKGCIFHLWDFSKITIWVGDNDVHFSERSQNCQHFSERCQYLVCWLSILGHPLHSSPFTARLSCDHHRERVGLDLYFFKTTCCVWFLKNLDFDLCPLHTILSSIILLRNCFNQCSCNTVLLWFDGLLRFQLMLEYDELCKKKQFVPNSTLCLCDFWYKMKIITKVIDTKLICHTFYLSIHSYNIHFEPLNQDNIA